MITTWLIAISSSFIISYFQNWSAYEAMSYGTLFAIYLRISTRA